MSMVWMFVWMPVVFRLKDSVAGGFVLEVTPTRLMVAPFTVVESWLLEEDTAMPFMV